MTDAELQLVKAAYGELEGIFAKADDVRKYLEHMAAISDSPIKVLEFGEWADDIHTAVGFALAFLGRVINPTTLKGVQP